MDTFIWHAIAATVLPIVGFLGAVAIITAVASKFFGYVPKGYRGKSFAVSTANTGSNGRLAELAGLLHRTADKIEQSAMLQRQTGVTFLVGGETIAKRNLERQLSEAHKALVEAEKSLEKLRAG
jgi:hypothetical protein